VDARTWRAPVDTFLGPLGVYSLGGNVHEWVFDSYDAKVYEKKLRGEIIEPSVQSEKVLRASSYMLHLTPPFSYIVFI